MSAPYNIYIHDGVKKLPSFRNTNIILVCFLALILTPLFGQNTVANDNSPTNFYSLRQFRQISPENQSYVSSLNGLYAQAIEEEIIVETYTPESSPDYRTGYYGTKDWQAFIAIYLWAVGMDGNVGKGNTVADVDVSFGDIWDNLDIGGQAHIEFWWKKWIFFVDPLYMKLSSKNSQTMVINTIKAKVEVKMFAMDLAMGYRVAELALSSGGTKSNNFKSWPALSIDMYGGGRILSVDNTTKLTLLTPIGERKQKINIDETWFDFIVGTRFIFDFTESLLLSVKTDIGGFGLGFSSDIDWNFTANLGYTLPWWGVTPYIGYRVLYVDYKNGSGDNRFVYDIWHTGPQIGVGIRF